MTENLTMTEQFQWKNCSWMSAKLYLLCGVLVLFHLDLRSFCQGTVLNSLSTLLPTFRVSLCLLAIATSPAQRCPHGSHRLLSSWCLEFNAMSYVWNALTYVCSEYPQLNQWNSLSTFSRTPCLSFLTFQEKFDTKWFAILSQHHLLNNVHMHRIGFSDVIVWNAG